MTSFHGNVMTQRRFPHYWRFVRESTCHVCILLTKRAFMMTALLFIWKKMVEHKIELPLIWDAQLFMWRHSRVTLYTAVHLHTAMPHCSHSRAPIVHTAVPRENNEHGCVYLRCRAVCKLPGCVEGHPCHCNARLSCRDVPWDSPINVNDIPQTVFWYGVRPVEKIYSSCEPATCSTLTSHYL